MNQLHLSWNTGGVQLILTNLHWWQCYSQFCDELISAKTHIYTGSYIIVVKKLKVVFFHEKKSVIAPSLESP